VFGASSAVGAAYAQARAAFHEIAARARLPRNVMAVLLSQFRPVDVLPPRVFGICRHCAVCLDVTCNRGRCTVCRRPLTPL
jgi:hypothetical protein